MERRVECVYRLIENWMVEHYPEVIELEDARDVVLALAQHIASADIANPPECDHLNAVLMTHGKQAVRERMKRQRNSAPRFGVH